MATFGSACERKIHAFNDVSQRTENVTGIYPRWDGNDERNECQDEKVAAVKLTHTLYLIFIFFRYWSIYEIVFRNSAGKSIESLKSNKFQVSQDRCWLLFSRSNNPAILQIYSISNFKWFISGISEELICRYRWTIIL